MELRLLGPVELWAAGQPVDAGSRQQRCVLAALAVDVGRPVMVETIVDRVWGEEPPDRVRETVYVYIARLRKLLDEVGASVGVPGRVLRRSRGYVLDVEPDRVDVQRFRHLVAQARDPACPDGKRLALLREALELWRGTPLENLPGAWASRTRAGWGQEHVDAAVAWAQAELAADDGATITGPLAELVDRYPLAESLTAALMRALHAAGNRAAALDCYERLRERLADQLGVDPGPELQNLHRSLVGGAAAPSAARGAASAATPGEGTAAPARGTTPGAAPSAATAPTAPAQLPLDVRGFTGRDDELDRLDALVALGAAQSTPVIISALSGTAGVGKTALAVHWAHQNRHRFRGGQLYVNLRGFDPGGSVMDPGDAIRGFLDALAVPAHRIPADLDAKAALYRSLLAERRMLVVLDNARDADQVRPLLPGASGSFVLVTSRNELPGLVATEGAQPLILDLLSHDEARNLLTRRLGADRTAAEPGAVDEIITACARLPLALAIAAAHAATNPHLPLTALAAELRGLRGRLDAFTGPDPVSDVRAVFSWSYRTLGTEAARLFRLLGLHPGADLAAPAAASLAGSPVARVRPLLAELARAHLLTEHVPGRYTFHDLLRAYAVELVQAHDPEADRSAATHRLLDHYVHTGYAAALLLSPNRRPITLGSAQPGTATIRLADREAALAWLEVEHRVLVAAVELAAEVGFDTHAWQLAWCLADFFDWRGQWPEQAATEQLAAAAARRVGDRGAEALAHRGIAQAFGYLGRHDEAEVHFRIALDLLGQLDDPFSQARVCLTMAWMFQQRRRYRDALDAGRQALELFERVQSKIGRSTALNMMGLCRAELGEYDLALTNCQQALVLCEEAGHRRGQAGNWDSLGYIHHHLGAYDEAVTCYERALELLAGLGDPRHEAEALAHLGDTHHAAGRPDAARGAWHRALDILRELDHPDAEQVRAKLAQLDQPGG